MLASCLCLGLVSCGKPAPEAPPPPSNSGNSYSGEKAVKVREETLVELLAVSDSVKKSLREHRDSESPDSIVRDLESLRPRLEYIRMQNSMLPTDHRRVILGNLAVATNELKDDLNDLIEKYPGNDPLIEEVVYLQKRLSPISRSSLRLRRASRVAATPSS